MADIVFLHTSPVHVATFDALVGELAPHLKVKHLVREDLLARAQREGVNAAPLVSSVQAALHEAAKSARVVACTCSTIGALAEAAASTSTVPTTRIDRAMADAAVRRGAPVLMVAALQSTLQPTTELLQSSATALAQPLVVRPLWVEAAWPHFEAGRRGDYIDAIASAVIDAAAPGETVVLAQASMAPAAERLAQRGLAALTSPRLGVEHAVRLCAQAAASTP